MRPEILFPLFAPSTSLKGVGPKVAPLVERLAGPLVRDLLLLAPSGVVDRRRATAAEAREGEAQIFLVRIDAHLPPRGAGQPYRIRVADETGFLFLVYFKVFGDSLKRQHPPGALRAVSGKVERWKFGVEFQINHPDYLLPVERLDEIPAFEAVYPATAGLPSRTVRRLAHEALERAPELPEWQDEAFRTREGFPGWRQALEALHSPRTDADTSLTTSQRRRLAYDELFAHQLAMAQRKGARRREPAPPIPAGATAARLEAALPFRLTCAQTMSLAEIRGDLAAGERMSRLLQGDVGAGKTVVAMLAMADAADAGLQSALMAPTEILARQHHETLAGPLQAQGVGVVLLTGRDKGPARAEKLRALASGEAKIAVGTHALFQDDVAFAQLGLAIIDEQHRFGVLQRAELRSKAHGYTPHTLVMTATPIPRTLAQSLYADLDLSLIDELPPGRTKVKTYVRAAADKPKIFDFVRKQAALGRQTYVVCPAIDDSERAVHSAVEQAESLRTGALKGLRVALLHGKMSGKQKDEIMRLLGDGFIQVLISTTVVEVGVDVPNASVMVVLDADMYGLAQLHQLRGRVGRGAAKSYCILVASERGPAESARLDILAATNDGFVIAEEDYRLRGSGDVAGTRQHGVPEFRLGNLIRDLPVFERAKKEADALVAADPGLSRPENAGLKRILESRERSKGLRFTS
jgi:ATP-dependent DNA helicase RecG